MRNAMLKFVAASTLALGAAVFATHAHAGKTLDAIKQRDQVVCGVNTGLAGFSAADSQGNWVGLDVDICKAIAAAVLGDAKKVKWVPLNAQQRFTALQSGEVDVLSRNTTFTLTRDASLGLFITAVTYYDGQGFIVTKKSKITSAKQLKNAEICVQSGTTTEKNLTDYFKSINVKIKPVVFEGFEASVKAFFSGRCQAYTTDASGLASIRNKEAANPDDYVILPELISKEPLGPMVRRGDDEWFTIVEMGNLRTARGRGVRTDAGQRRSDEEQHGTPGPAHSRYHRGYGQAARPGQGMGVPRNQGRRQLWRNLRTQCRPPIGAEIAARPQQSLEQGRAPVRTANPLTAPASGACIPRNATGPGAAGRHAA